MSVISNAVSGLFASQLRVSNAASNIANANSSNFVPKDVVQTAVAGGATNAQLVDRTPATLTTLNADGTHDEVPNVDITSEVVATQLGTYDFKANATVLKTERDLQKKLLDIFA